MIYQINLSSGYYRVYNTKTKRKLKKEYTTYTDCAKACERLNNK